VVTRFCDRILDNFHGPLAAWAPPRIFLGGGGSSQFPNQRVGSREICFINLRLTRVRPF
jgi:hypothetical protein